MNNQVSYYNQFGKKFTSDILECPEPWFWTTDYSTKGRIYQEIKKRIEQQQILIRDSFSNKLPVLDIGCGFGRQACLLAKKGFIVTGTDTSEVFIEIARRLFEQNNYKGNFYCIDIITDYRLEKIYHQVLLFDVLEHIKPAQRKKLFIQLYTHTESGAKIIVSIPHIRKRVSSQLNNKVRRLITQHFTFFTSREEHPYPIPEMRNMQKLLRDLFSINGTIETTETDYYIISRK